VSWDVVLLDAPQSINSAEEITADTEIIPFDRRAVIEKISARHPEAVDFSNPAWGHIAGDGWSIEVNIGDDDLCSSIMLHVRGAGDPVPGSLEIAGALGVRALDCSSGEFLSAKSPEAASFAKWQAYRDQVVGASRTSSFWERIRSWLGGR
jgi:hypothetical protein